MPIPFRSFVINSPVDPRGFGFAEFLNDEEADRAVQTCNGQDFLGRALVVNEARPMREGGGGGGGEAARRRSGGRGGGRWRTGTRPLTKFLTRTCVNMH